MSNRPNCPSCGQQVSTGAAINGKPTYFCINRECADRFKTLNAPSPSKGKTNA